MECLCKERAFAWIFYLTSYIPRNDNTRKIENSFSLLYTKLNDE